MNVAGIHNTYHRENAHIKRKIYNMYVLSFVFVQDTRFAKELRVCELANRITREEGGSPSARQPIGKGLDYVPSSNEPVSRINLHAYVDVYLIYVICIYLSSFPIYTCTLHDSYWSDRSVYDYC